MSSPTEESKSPESAPSPDTLMKQYQMMVDIYKFHFEIVLKFIIFYYAVTGAILSFYLSQPNTGFMRFALVLPIFMGFVFCVFAFFGASQVAPIKNHMVRVTGALHLEPFPNVNLLNRLEQMLRVTGVLSCLIAICLIVVSVAR